MNDEVIEVQGTILGEIGKKTDKNGNDFYHGQLDCDDGHRYTFFFFRPEHDLSMRIEELKGGERVSLKGGWGKRTPVVFIATGFYLEEEQGWTL